MKRKLSLIILMFVLFAGGYAGIKALASSVYANAVMEMKQGRFEVAKRKLEWLAMFGDARAQIYLGEMYAYGWGISRDRNEAIKWFRRAAEKTLPLSKEPAAASAYFVGVRFAEGLGVQQDFEEAAWWINFAKTGGYSPDSIGSRQNWSYPNIPFIMLAGDVAYRNYRAYLHEHITNHEENSDYLRNLENYDINIKTEDNYYLIDITPKLREKHSPHAFGAKYKIDKEKIKIFERVILN